MRVQLAQGHDLSTMLIILLSAMTDGFVRSACLGWKDGLSSEDLQRGYWVVAALNPSVFMIIRGHSFSYLGLFPVQAIYRQPN